MQSLFIVNGRAAAVDENSFKRDILYYVINRPPTSEIRRDKNILSSPDQYAGSDELYRY